MVDRIVQEVPAEGFNGEGGAVAAETHPRPLVTRHGVETPGKLTGGYRQLPSNSKRILKIVSVGNGGCILIPIDKRG